MRFITPALALLALCGCNPFENQRIGYNDCRPWGGSGWTHLFTDPEHCGRCNHACGEGVPCVDGECQIDTVMNCGEPGRVCVAIDGEDVECVRFYDGDASVGDGGPPEGVELVNGYGCVSVEGSSSDSGVGEGDAGVQGAKKDGRWLLLAGHTPECAKGLDKNGCVTGEVALTDLCGGAWTEPFAYDFAIMTREMTRAQFRDVMCDCTNPRFSQCVDLCTERFAPDAEVLAEQPMTGINWCEAYTACQRIPGGGRLPTVRERARLEALVEGPETLFDESATCGAWLGETGRVPWLAECLEGSSDDLGYDNVKGMAGQVLIGRGVLTEPEPVHHLVGNVDEWMADPARVLIGGTADDEAAVWGLPRDEETARGARLLRGRSLFSPAGLPGSRLLRVEASIKAKDVGVRCARTLGAPYDEAVPYDASILARDYARCVQEPAGLRPVRRTVGEPVYAATDVCIDSERDLPADFRSQLRNAGRELFIDSAAQTFLTRRVSAGLLQEVGPARITVEEQWWLSPPAPASGGTVGVLPTSSSSSFIWRGEEMPRTTRCMEMASGSAPQADGRLVRRYVFELPAEAAARLAPITTRQACAHLGCIDIAFDADLDTCATDCPGWLLPLAIEFERVEPTTRAGLCQ